jgi:hypothetical protein
VVDRGRLLSGCRAKKLYRGFESHPPRQIISSSATRPVADFLFFYTRESYPFSWVKAGVRDKYQKARELVKMSNWQAKAMAVN